MPQTPEEQADNLPTAEPERAEASDSSQYSKRSVIVTMLRWVAVLPAALAAYFAIQLLIILGDAIMAERHAEWFLQLVNSFASAYAFVFAGAHTAPRYQFTVGIVLAIIFAAFLIALLSLGYFIKTTDPFWWLALAGVISLAGVVAAISQLRDDKWQLK